MPLQLNRSIKVNMQIRLAKTWERGFLILQLLFPNSFMAYFSEYETNVVIPELL